LAYTIQKSRKKSILLLIIIFIGSYAILGFNIEGQGIDIDEMFHHGFAMTYFDLTKEGKILDPCITGKGTCELIDLTCAGQVQWVASGGIVKGILIGLGDNFFSDNERIYYASDIAQQPCRPIHNGVEIPGVNIPTQSELGAARFFSPIFGAMTVVLSFLIGTILFNRFTGIIFSIILLFHGLWIHHSRILISEVYVNFFMILTVFLLLYALNSKEKLHIKYLILSGITFALAVSTKITSLEILPFLIIIIIFRGTIKEKMNFKKLKNINFIQKSLLFTGVFLGVFIISLIVTFPFYWVDPIGQMIVQYDVAFSGEYGAITEPWTHTKKIFLPFVESAIIVPIIDSYYHIFLPENIPESAKNGHTFSSIPLSLFFVIGVGYLILKIKRKTLLFSEFLILVWYISIHVFLSLTLESYNTSRHFIPIIFPMILIMSYGLWRFLKNFSYTKTKIFFIGLVLFCHAITILIFSELIYFKPDMIWIMPSIITFRDALSNPIVLYSGIIFIFIFSYVYIKKIKLKNVNLGHNAE
jgi:hypothetical protein